MPLYTFRYETPPGFSDLILASDGEVLTGLRFVTSGDPPSRAAAAPLPIFRETVGWLDLYFQGVEPEHTPRYRVIDPTPFRKEILDILMTIPYGQTVTYRDIADQIARSRGVARMSAQAVGGAVGWNPIGILIPCHRVIGADGSLTGYRGGLENKRALLRLEENHRL